MKSELSPFLLAAGLALCTLLPANAGPPVLDAGHVLPGGTTCAHVIHLIHRHGVNNSVNHAWSNSMLHHSPLGSMVIPGQELGDLEVVQVNEVVHQDDACGPRIAVVIRNNSCRSVCNFHVSAVALLGRICPTSPNATVKVAEIASGENLEVHVTLPLEALAMGNRNGQAIGFQRLIVAIDSLDELVETNEANNLKAIDRSCLTVVTPTVESTVETISTTGTEVVQQDVATQTATRDVGVATPNPQATGTDALQSAIRKLDGQQPASTPTTGSP